MLNQCCNYLPCYFDAFFCPESKRSKRVNPFQPIVAFHIETSHLFCSARQMASFYMKRNTGLKWVNNSVFPTSNKTKTVDLILFKFYFASKNISKASLQCFRQCYGDCLDAVVFFEVLQKPRHFWGVAKWCKKLRTYFSFYQHCQWRCSWHSLSLLWPLNKIKCCFSDIKSMTLIFFWKNWYTWSHPSLRI